MRCADGETIGLGCCNRGAMAALARAIISGYEPDAGWIETRLYLYPEFGCFPDKGAIGALLHHLEAHPHTGFAGSQLHGPDGEAHRTAFQFPTIASEFETQIRLGLVSRILHRSVVAQALPVLTSRVDWLAGASLMMRQSVLDRIGLFDERFFLYFEETELCLRAARAGYTVDYVVESQVEHMVGISAGMREWTRIPQFSARQSLALFHQITWAGLCGGGYRGPYRRRRVLARAAAGAAQGSG